MSVALLKYGGPGVRALSWGNCDIRSGSRVTVSPKAGAWRKRLSRLGSSSSVASHRRSFRPQPLRWSRLEQHRARSTRASLEPEDDTSEAGQFVECVTEHFSSKSIPNGPPERTLQMYLCAPSAQYALLNAVQVERLGDGRFRCFGRKFDAFGLQVEPIVNVTMKCIGE